MIDTVSTQNRKAINILIRSSIPPLRQALVLLKQENSEGRQFDISNAPDLPIEELVDIVNEIENIYYQEEDFIEYIHNLRRDFKNEN